MRSELVLCTFGQERWLSVSEPENRSGRISIVIWTCRFAQNSIFFHSSPLESTSTRCFFLNGSSNTMGGKAFLPICLAAIPPRFVIFATAGKSYCASSPRDCSDRVSSAANVQMQCRLTCSDQVSSAVNVQSKTRRADLIIYKGSGRVM